MSEKDPLGIDQHDPGAKLDAGKLRPDLVFSGFSRALWQVAAVGTYGAHKYSENGWLQVPSGIKRYSDAHLRHSLRRWVGEDVDPETGLMHLAHEAWNALAVLELAVRQIENAGIVDLEKAPVKLSNLELNRKAQAEAYALYAKP
jgi:hypothetical protein